MFQWSGGQAKEVVLADTGTQNQVVLPWRGGLLMADANHGAYGRVAGHSRATHSPVTGGRSQTAERMP